MNASIQYAMVVFVFIGAVAAQQPTHQSSVKAPDPLANGFYGHGRAKDGTLLTIATIVRPNGERVGVTQGKFPTREAANREMYSRIKQTTVVEKAAIRDASGKVTGERVVAHFPEVKRNVITWTEEDHFVWVVSTSLSEALSVEEELRREETASRQKGKSPN